MQQQAEAQVYMHEADRRMTDNLLLLSADDYTRRFVEESHAHQWDEELLPQLAHDVAGIAGLLDPLPELSPLAAQSEFLLAGMSMHSLSTPGHTDGHQCFLGGNRVLISGDNLLANYHLHATDWPHNKLANPLHQFLSSMDQLAQFPIEKVLPGHGPVFANYHSRLQQLFQHHLSRMNIILQELKEPQTAWQLARQVFPGAD